MVEPPETTFVKKTETWFTLIEIHTIVKNRKYAAKFKTTEKFTIECEITGNTVQECIDKTAKLLDFEITEKHYIIK